MGTPPPDAQWYLPTVVTVCIDGVWMSGFEFAAIRGANVHVITAWNPGDERPALEINEEWNEQLRAEISARGLEVLEALGSDPNSSHAEKSWAVVGMSDDAAVEFGKKYGQLAVFRVSAGMQTVLGCFSDWNVSRRAEDKGRSAVFAKVKDLRDESGQVMLQEVKWNPRNWDSPQLAMFQPQISMFADGCQGAGDSYVIRRGDVIELSKSMEDIFIGAMIFGYGPVGYGPSRVGRVISENHDLIEKLNRQYEAAKKGPESSWNSHTGQNKVKYFGPAFATKFAYFAARKQQVEGVIPLIADINTSWAMWWLTGIPRSVEQQNSYSEYVRLAHDWGGEIHGAHGADEIERAVFEIGKNLPKKTDV